MRSPGTETVQAYATFMRHLYRNACPSLSHMPRSGVGKPQAVGWLCLELVGAEIGRPARILMYIALKYGLHDDEFPGIRTPKSQSITVIDAPAVENGA